MGRFLVVIGGFLLGALDCSEAAAGRLDVLVEPESVISGGLEAGDAAREIAISCPPEALFTTQSDRVPTSEGPLGDPCYHFQGECECAIDGIAD